MRLLITGGVLFGFLALTACTTVDPAFTRPQGAVAAQPHIEAALKQPMDALWLAAANADPNASLDLGLALLAGRRPPENATDKDDWEVMAQLEGRHNRAFIAYADTHGHQRPKAKDWPEILPLSTEEREAFARYQRTTADYWLSRALFASTSQTLYIYQPPVRLGGAGGVMPIQTTTPVLDGNMILTASHCIHALRAVAGFPSPAENDYVHDVIAAEGGQDSLDFETLLAGEAARENPKRPYFTGPAACGSLPQFQRYTAWLVGTDSR